MAHLKKPIVSSGGTHKGKKKQKKKQLYATIKCSDICIKLVLHFWTPGTIM